MWNRTERKLLVAAREGGRGEFDDLIAPLVDDLRSFVSARVEASEADDIVQDVLLATWKALPMFDGRSRFRTWVFGICMHKVKDHYRSRSRRKPETSLDSGLIEPMVEGEQLKFELACAIGASLDELSPSQAEVIDLYYRRRMTLAEVSETLDRNLNTVKYQFCQAHVRLAKIFKDNGIV